MPEKIVPGPVGGDCPVREAVCVHTNKIMDGCRGQDCLEDLRVYLSRCSQEVVDRAISVKAGCAELLYAYIDVEPIGFNRGFYTVDVRYYYRITADAFVGAVRPVEVTGLAVFDKRASLSGGEGCAKVFTSQMACGADPQGVPGESVPTAVVEAVDPLVLGMKLVDVCDCKSLDSGSSCTEIPCGISACFPEELVMGGDVHRLYVTLGQFSLIRLERDTQLLIPTYDYCMPEKECCSGLDCPVDDPCEIFRQVSFPVDDFFPTPNSGCSNCGCN